MLTAFLLLAALAQDAPPAPFLWSIEGLWDPQPTLLVTITPTPLGRVSGLDIQSIAIEPVPTPDDPIRRRCTQPKPSGRLGRACSHHSQSRDGASR